MLGFRINPPLLFRVPSVFSSLVRS